ncbi:MAG: hypothetical protein ACOYWZ_01820 [Bacillota bacterium]
MEKVMQPKKNLKLTDAEKKVLLAYSVHASDEGLRPAPGTTTLDKKLLS